MSDPEICRLLDDVDRARKAVQRQEHLVACHASSLLTQQARLSRGRLGGSSERMVAFATGALRGSVFRWRELDEELTVALGRTQS